MQMVATDPNESKNVLFYDEIERIPMNYDSQFWYCLPIAIIYVL